MSKFPLKASLSPSIIWSKKIFIKKFGAAGSKAAIKDLDQLHKQNCFSPVDVSTLTATEKSESVNSLLFLTKNHSGEVKGRMVYNGKPTRKWLSKKESASSLQV